jgi:hypothetical protein
MKTKENIRDARDYVRQHPMTSRNNTNSGYYGYTPDAPENYPSEYPRPNEHREQHDYGTWGTPSFTQNTSARELDRVNSRFDRFHSRLGRRRSPESSQGHYDLSYYSDDASGPDRTWDEKSNESYLWEGSDKRERHGHAGKGPKGYKRSDERIMEDVHERLSDDNFLDASGIEVNVTGGDVILTGTVADKTDKRRAEDIAESVSGVTNVENRIRVSRANV